jgi:SH3-like domain-containing protein
MTVAVNRGRVRRGPGTDKDIVAQLNRGDTVEVIETREDWHRIRLSDGFTGWAYADLFKEKARRRPAEPVSLESRAPEKDILTSSAAALHASLPKRLTVTVGRGRVRAAPSLSADVAFYLDRGETAVILESDGEWYRIGLPDGRIGWTHKRLFEKKTPDGELRGIRVEHPSGREERVVFTLSGVLIPAVYSLSGDSVQLVCDFSNTLPVAELKRTVEVGSGLIRRIHVGVHEEPQTKTLVVLDLAPGKDYEVDQYFFEKGFTYVLMLRSRSLLSR